jgi:hypothetical protein
MRNIAHDKLLHFFVATFVSFALINLFLYYGFVVCLLGFAGKEIIYDKIMKKGKPEILDFVYGAVPAILILITKVL